MVLCHCNEFNSETISKLHIERTRRMLPWTGCFKGSSSSRASVKLAPKFRSRGLHVPSLTLPPFTCAGVSSQRASSERGTGSGTGNRAPKKQENENSEVSKSKKRKEIQGVQKCAAENPKAWHGDARRKRCQMKVILVETRNLASVFPALDAGQEPCGDAVPTNRRKFTNRNITTIATYPTCMAAHSISVFPHLPGEGC